MGEGIAKKERDLSSRLTLQVGDATRCDAAPVRPDGVNIRLCRLYLEGKVVVFMGEGMCEVVTAGVHFMGGNHASN